MLARAQELPDLMPVSESAAERFIRKLGQLKTYARHSLIYSAGDGNRSLPGTDYHPALLEGKVRAGIVSGKISTCLRNISLVFQTIRLKVERPVCP